MNLNEEYTEEEQASRKRLGIIPALIIVSCSVMLMALVAACWPR